MVSTHDDWVQFSVYRPGASSVEVVGDFTGWQRGRLRLHREDGGKWTGTLQLQPGTYRFRYLVDEQWMCDFAAFGIEYRPDGINALLHVDGAVDAEAVLEH
jgi:1,4-alpha-glucan branching enzyme